MKNTLINRCKLSKTLRFALIPIGETEENIRKGLLIDEDTHRAESYKKVKEYIDRYHRMFIEDVLNKVRIDGLGEYAAMYGKAERTEDEAKHMRGMEEGFRAAIAKAFKSDKRFSTLFKKDLIEQILPEFLTEEEERKAVEEFYSFTTYFANFNTNRKNLYTDEEKSVGIAYRCINDNLPKILDNIRTFQRVREHLPPEDLSRLNRELAAPDHITVEDMFTVDYFNEVLAQSGIDRYNEMLGGVTFEDKPPVQGLNQYINLYNQQIARPQRKPTLPLMKPLFKQILSDRETSSFLPEQFPRNDPDAVLRPINDCFTLPDGENPPMLAVMVAINSLFSRLSEFDRSSIYMENGAALTTVSNDVFGNWSAVRDSWMKEYENLHPRKKQSEEKYAEAQQKAYKAVKSFSIAQADRYGKSDGDEKGIAAHYAASMSELTNKTARFYEEAKELLTRPYTDKKRLSSNMPAVEQIKKLLDSVKEVERMIRLFLGTGREAEKDERFYGELAPLYESLRDFDALYNKVRGFMTQKPYSVEKIKLNFNNPQLLGGWDKNKESDYMSVLMRRGESYFLGIMDKSSRKVFVNVPPSAPGEECYEKMEYKLLPGPEKMLPKVFFAKSKADQFPVPDEIRRIYSGKTFAKGKNFSIDDCRALIDHYKTCIEKHPDWNKFGFAFSDTSEYQDISGFFNEIAEQAYKISFVPVPASYIDRMVEEGALYLFRLYNKDFSEHSKGKKNLHTLYFQMLFDERNLKDPVYKLCGGGEMFYRPASITEPEEMVVHEANQPINRRTGDGQKSLFPYDIVKNRRYTKPQFELHLPIQMNFKAPSHPAPINLAVREELKKCDDVHIIGIDRGERNLLYLCMIDGEGRIEAQTSLNLIPGGNGENVNYHTLLDKKESGRTRARQDWAEIENIKELKAGYLSQAIHVICQWVKKHDATIIAMENLNAGFIQSRGKVEKQVYQKFEKMLADKLSFLVDKDRKCDEDGGLLRAYQLAEPMKEAGRSSIQTQNGILFYVPAWLTSKIDPVTGFASLLYTKYNSVEEARDLIGRFDSIRFNAAEDRFEFVLDYSQFPRGSADFRKVWTVCTYGERVRRFRDKARNNEFSYRIVSLTEEYKNLFAQYGISYENGDDLRETILAQDSSAFFSELFRCIRLTLQMRNSIPAGSLDELGGMEGDSPLMRQSVANAREKGTDVDFLISPVSGADGQFFDTRVYENDSDAKMPVDSDANGAYNIARKALWAVEQIKTANDLNNVRLSITQAEWLRYVQEGEGTV